MTKYISEELTEERISRLTNEYFYLLGGECGSGKTQAIMKNLFEYAKKENKQILYLCNRSSLEEQLKEEQMERVNEHMTIGMYQSITTFVGKNFCLPFHKMIYDYVVVDEAHLIFDSSDYDINPLLFVEYLNNVSSIVLALTGTPKGFMKLKKYLKRDIEVLREVDKANYSIRNVYFTEDYNEFIEYKRKSLKGSFKNLELTNTVGKFKSFKEQNNHVQAANIASKHRKDFDILMNSYDKEVRSGIIKSQKMICEALIATTAMEVGVNIKAQENYLVSFNSLPMPSTIVQFASRVRVARDDPFYVDLIFYLEKPSKKIINFMKERLRKINRFYKSYEDYENGIKQYNWALGEKDFFMGIVDCREFNPITKECLEEKIVYYEKFYESKNPSLDYENLLTKLFPNANIIDLERSRVEEFLNEIMHGKETLNFYDEEDKISLRKMLKELGIKSKAKSNIPSINLINKFFKDHRVKFELLQGKSRLNGEKNQKRYWKLVRHVV